MNFQTIKSTPEAIRRNFDQQVERFSNLETGQTTAIDSPLCMELVAFSAAQHNPAAKNILDLGCGGGNYAVKVSTLLTDVDCTLVDLSANMLACGLTKVDGPGIALSFRKSSRVVINEPALIPTKFMRQPEPPPGDDYRRW